MRDLNAEIREVEEKLARLKRAREANVKVEKDKIEAVSKRVNDNEIEFMWNCKATQSQIAEHTKATIKSAFTSFGDDKKAKMGLSLEIIMMLEIEK